MKVLSNFMQRPELRRRSYMAAFWAGVVGAAAMSVVLWVFRAFGWAELNISLALGSMFTGSLGAAAAVLGFIVHLAAGGIFALAYAALFHRAEKTGADTGALYGIGHWVIGGIIMGLLPGIHMLMPEIVVPPGFFAVNYGWFDFVLFLGLHVMYGAIVGGMHARAVAEWSVRTTTGRDQIRAA